MANPNETELLPPSGAVTRGPALGSPELSTEYLARIKENLEVLLGRRGGSDWDRAVTFRDLHGMGWHGGAGGGGMVFNMAGVAELDASAPGFQQFVGRLSDEIMRSTAFKALKARIGSAESNAHLPDEIKRQLQLSLLQVAREHQAAIETVENKIQTSTLSMASRLKEITASLERTAAGVREFDVAYADRTQAIALKVTQLAASLEGAGSVELEERFEAIASAIDGLKGQWSIKIQTDDPENPVIAGIALAVEDPIAGPGTSSLIFMAERFGFVTENGTTTPFVILGNQIEFTGNVRINGNLVIGPNGLQPGFEAPSTKNSEANFTPKLVWEFRNSLDGWSLSGLSNATGPDSFDCTASNTGPTMFSPTFVGFSGAIHDKIRMRVRRANAIAGQWRAYYATANHGFDAAYVKEIPDTTKVGEWVTLEWDMSALTDWTTSQITRIRIDVGTSTGGQFGVDWVCIGKHGVFEGDPDSTRGAPTGSEVAGVSAAIVAAGAAAGMAAYDQVPGINADIATRLKRDANNTLTGQIALQSSMALLVGTTLNGIWIGTDGIYATEGGVVKVSIPLNGAPTFDGVLMAAGVITGAVSIAAGGKLTVGATTFGGEGVFLGYVGNVVKFSIVSGASKLLYDPTATPPLQIIKPGLELDKPAIAAMSAINSPAGGTGVRILPPRTAVPTAGRPGFSFMWRFEPDFDSVGQIQLYSGVATDTLTLTVSPQPAGTSVGGWAYVDMKDANGLSTTGNHRVDAYY